MACISQGCPAHLTSDEGRAAAAAKLVHEEQHKFKGNCRQHERLLLLDYQPLQVQAARRDG